MKTWANTTFPLLPVVISAIRMLVISPNPACIWGHVAWSIIPILMSPHCGLCDILVHSPTFKQSSETPHSLFLYCLLWGHNFTMTPGLCVHQMLSIHPHVASCFLPATGILTLCAPTSQVQDSLVDTWPSLLHLLLSQHPPQDTCS